MSFENASVTKGLMMGSALSSICVGMFDLKHYFHLQFVPHISRHHQYWRLLTHNLAFINSSDLFLALIIFYNIGIPVERRFGSVKYASYAVITLLLGTILEFISLILFHRVGLNHIALGPALLSFSLLYQYSRIVPTVYTYKIAGISLSSKSLHYFLGLQLAISRVPGSLLVAAAGIISGQLYRSDLAGLKSYRLSPRVVRFSRAVLLPLVGSLRSPRRSTRALPSSEDAAAAAAVTAGTASATTRSTGVAPGPGTEEGAATTARRTPRPNRGVPIPATPVPLSGDAATRAHDDDDEHEGESTATTNPSMVRTWVDQLTGRPGGPGAPSMRAPSEDEIAQVRGIFPDLDREVVVGALQRSPNIEAAVETLLLSQS